jgi:hypothetical protein
MAGRGSFHWENGAAAVIVCGLFVAGARAKKLLLGVYPLGLVGLLYEAMKPLESLGVTPGRVHLCDLRAAELWVFGVGAGASRVTLHDRMQAHPSAVLDALCALPYGTFLFVCVACAVWLYLRDYPRMVRFGWCFFALNVVGFATYHVYPAAPPWYFHVHGCTIDLAARASEGANLARVDAWTGVPFFAGMYGRASDVFGAVPSLHVAYALLVVLLGWPTFSPAWRAATLSFLLVMSFAAVYLDHHWVLDVIAGAAYCVVVVAASGVVVRMLGRTESPTPAPATRPVMQATRVPEGAP